MVTHVLERLAIDWSLPPKLVTSAILAQFPSPSLVLAVTQMLYAVFGDSPSRVYIDTPRYVVLDNNTPFYI